MHRFVFPFISTLAVSVAIGTAEPNNLNLEKGNLTGWTATGDAWTGQPVKGDTVTPRRRGQASQHQGQFWIGGYEPSRSDSGTGTLTSKPFKVTKPWASFLIGGGKQKGTRVEIIDTSSGKPIFTAHGEDRENMRRVTVDLTNHQGKTIAVRLIDEAKGGWGHINYDDFQFHDKRPIAKPGRLGHSHLLKHLTPNPSASKNETVRDMWIPEGFQVDLIASEPEIRQPIAFTFDAKGRIWLAEALAYPRRQKDGKGQDRLIILEDRDGNGSFETKKIFADKLNLVSGFEIGYGGVFVGAAPHLLFIPDANGDDKPDGPAKVLLDGWDLKDTHETPNSFMWGHDGWLYGCHGVFNDSYVGKPGTPKAQRTHIKAGVWRFHPVTHKFEIYAHGGSNQWGLDYNADGAMFMTHCRSSWGLGPVSQVIRDGHYWTQNNGNHRDFIATARGGWNNVNVPHSNLLRSIAKYGHGEGGAGRNGSRAIYGGHSHVGTMVYLGDNWPDSYRHNLYTHNLHGHQMNREKLTLAGSGYRSESEGHDQLYAPDKRYLAVDLKYGPDGAVYSIDWHDTQQCHSNNQAIWDRTNGRIYRMAWKQTYRPVKVDLTKSSDSELLKFLHHKNEWFARMAQHQLRQRAASNRLDSSTKAKLAEQLFHPKNPHRLRYLVALYGINGITQKMYRKLLHHPEETIRAQAIHFLTEQSHAFSSQFQNDFATLARTDPSARVRLAIAGACQHRIDPKTAKGLLRLLAMRQEDATDQFIPKMIWFAYAQFAAQDISYALALALDSKLPEFRDSVLWYAARKDLNKAVAYTILLTDPKQVSRFIAIVHQVLGNRKTAKIPVGWDKLILKAESDAATQKHFTALNRIFHGQASAKEDAAARIAKGKSAFMICAACHAPGKDQPGPSLEEIAQVYTTKKDIIQWVKKPGKKRAKYPAMPAFNHMDDQSLQLIAEYLMSLRK
ncbi:MAG: PVC-type heme-binding CxxCH protein [Akkermansiaceae bacterium]